VAVTPDKDATAALEEEKLYVPDAAGVEVGEIRSKDPSPRVLFTPDHESVGVILGNGFMLEEVAVCVIEVLPHGSIVALTKSTFAGDVDTALRLSISYINKV
jgi:hypothetical protein